MKQLFDMRVVRRIMEKVESCAGNLDLEDDSVCRELGITCRQAQEYFFQMKAAGFIIADDRDQIQIVSPSLLWKALQSLNAFDNIQD